MYFEFLRFFFIVHVYCYKPVAILLVFLFFFLKSVISPILFKNKSFMWNSFFLEGKE